MRAVSAASGRISELAAAGAPEEEVEAALEAFNVARRVQSRLFEAYVRAAVDNLLTYI
ncbi:hypothetical protein ACHAQH_004265 [Verticillium albo-atrum]